MGTLGGGKKWPLYNDKEALLKGRQCYLQLEISMALNTFWAFSTEVSQVRKPRHRGSGTSKDILLEHGKAQTKANPQPKLSAQISELLLLSARDQRAFPVLQLRGIWTDLKKPPPTQERQGAGIWRAVSTGKLAPH